MTDKGVHDVYVFEYVCAPEVLGASRADVLVQVVPLVFLQSLVAELHPAGHKLSIRMWRTQAVAVLDLSRLVRVPNACTHTHTHDSQLLAYTVTLTDTHVYLTAGMGGFFGSIVCVFILDRTLIPRGRFNMIHKCRISPLCVRGCQVYSLGQVASNSDYLVFEANFMERPAHTEPVNRLLLLRSTQRHQT